MDHKRGVKEPVPATSLIRSQKDLFLLVLSRCNQISAPKIAVLMYKTSIYFFRTYVGIAHFFRSYLGIFRSVQRAFWILRARFISELCWNSQGKLIDDLEGLCFFPAHELFL